MLIFVFSTGRTGTVYLSNLLSKLPNVTTYHERSYRLFRCFQNFKIYSKKISILDNVFINYYKMKLSKISNDTFHFEINPPFIGHLNKLIHNFPEARFIHIVRDPKDYVKSNVNWSNNKTFNKLFKIYFPYWEVKPEKYNYPDIPSKLFEVSVASWHTKNLILSDIEEETSNYYLFKFEDLKSNPLQFLNSLLASIDYPYLNQINKYIDFSDISSYKNESSNATGLENIWSESYLSYINDNCSNLIKKFNYE